MPLLSARGTVDTILVLVIVWLLLRYFMRQDRPASQNGPAQRSRTGDERRPQGDVRIERIKEVKHAAPPTNVEDAEFEEIK